MLTAALGILCGLALTVFAAMARLDARHAAALLAGLGTALLAPRAWLQPEPIALLAALAAACLLWRPAWTAVAAAGAGALAWAWVVVLGAQGLTQTPAVLLAAAAAGSAAAGMRRRPGFASRYIVEEALLIVATFAAVLACAPAVSRGYETALGLRAMPLGESSIPPSAGAFGLAAACAIAGGLFALWRSR